MEKRGVRRLRRLFRSAALRAVALALSFVTSVAADDGLPMSAALADGYELRFRGGIRLQAGTFGTSRVAWNVGPIAVAGDGRSAWVAGHAHHFSLARFELPTTPVISTQVADFPIAPLADGFVKVSPPVVDGKAPDRITGIELFGRALIVNVAEYYDADVDNRQTTVIFDDAWDLDAGQRGYFRLQGAVHAAGWMSPLPEDLQSAFGAPYLAGFASNLPIDGRSSMGPSLFLWDPAAPMNSSRAHGDVPSTALLDYSLAHPLHPDMRNDSLTNDLWTGISRAVHGFFTPGKSHYLVVGRSGGHSSGLGYKITRENGQKCQGLCPVDYRDTDNYYWLYDVEDLLSVHAGAARPYDPLPSTYGTWPVSALGKEVAGADFNASTGLLYLLINGADSTQNRHESQPVILVYELLTLPPTEPIASDSRSPGL